MQVKGNEWKFGLIKRNKEKKRKEKKRKKEKEKEKLCSSSLDLLYFTFN